MLAIGLCSTLIALVVAAKMLENLPPMIAAGIVFSVIVFVVVCGAAYLKTDVKPRRSGPPQLQFRKPRRARRTKVAP
jgi:hypothetical protein